MIILSGTGTAGGLVGCGLLSTAPTTDLEFNLVGECLVGGDGDTVTSWEDSSPAGNDASLFDGGGTTKQTNEINGLSIIRPGTTTWRFASSIPVTSNFTYIGVIKPLLSIGHQTLISGGVGALQVRIGLGKINIVKRSVVDMGSSTTTISTSAFSTIGVTYDGSMLRFYLNGVADGTVSVAQTFSANVLDLFINNGVENWEGDIAEQLLWSVVLDESTHLLNGGSGVTAELRTKYAHY